jgi:hypothetical protein
MEADGLKRELPNSASTTGLTFHRNSLQRAPATGSATEAPWDGSSISNRAAEGARSGIRSDPNRPDDEESIVRLVGQVVRVSVSVETVKIVEGLPPREAAFSFSYTRPRRAASGLPESRHEFNVHEGHKINAHQAGGAGKPTEERR